MKMNTIYLDNASTTGPDPKVVEAVASVSRMQLGNASSIHQLGLKAATKIERCRQVIADRINASPEEIFFTSCGTESNNLALTGFFQANRHRGWHIIVSQIEHPSVLDTAQWLGKEGATITYLPVDKWGLVDPKQLEAAITEETILVSIMQANNEVGTVQDIAALGNVCGERGIAFHSDACQSFLKVPIDVKRQNLDLLSMSAHKIHGPRGVAALYVRKGISLAPLLHGGGQEMGLRSGTYNTEAIVGLRAAVEVAQESDVERMKFLRDHMLEKLRLKFPHVIVNGHLTSRLCNNLNFTLPHLSSKKLLQELDRKGIYVSIGSACSASKKVPSKVLLAMGRTQDEALESVRVSLSKWTTMDELDNFLQTLELIVAKEGSHASTFAGGL